ncbi:microcystin degradation protein MlrC [Thioclava sp. SK-1]|uniref:M81 family metallopeptidase n=1 Tax=Thioclava sp. SK-1 TaxID=1889770 RepID=UPI0008257825|nr:M81 family metallopeptidase [Thioclava sp. SK-1]OCX66538.1 microcystin degradation protein MlrC [Thioclava sp. SK-1]
MAPKIAIAAFLHETNTFAPSKATYDDFAHGGGAGRMLRGQEIIDHMSDVNAAISGAIRYGRDAGWDLCPALACATSPSAHVTMDAFERITHETIDRIVAFGPLDGVFLDLHGAMVTEHLDDGEGEFLRRLRAAIGTEIPIVTCLDLHANVTQLMFSHADVLESYRTYPHVDMAQTGLRGARALDAMLTGARPQKAMRIAPYLSAIAWQCTADAPAKGLYERLSELAGKDRQMSFNMGFPAADFPECQMSVLAYGPDADDAADQMIAAVIAAEPAFKGRVYTPEDSVAQAMRIAATAPGKPVVICDTQDNPGAGADSNTTGMIRAMVTANASGAIGNLYDCDAALAAHQAGVGAQITVALGGQSRVDGDAPFTATFTVTHLSDGTFPAQGPYYRGKTMNMGLSACLQIDQLKIVVVSAKAQMADRSMFAQVGIDPQQEPILIVKSSNHFRADFDPISAALLTCAAPGPMAVDPALLPWTRLRNGMRMGALGPAFQNDSTKEPA